MSDLARKYRNSSTSPAIPEEFSRGEGKALQRATNREVGAAIVATTRLGGARYVASQAMQHTASLAREAYALADGDEYLASRLGMLLDSYVQFSYNEITNLRGMR